MYSGFYSQSDSYWKYIRIPTTQNYSVNLCLEGKKSLLKECEVIQHT